MTVFRSFLLVFLIQNTLCFSSIKFYAYIGDSVQIRCYINETSKFTRINHFLSNNTRPFTILSNEMVNDKLNTTGMRIEKHKTHYEIKIDTVNMDSAGVYTCEDDVSLMDKNGHYSNFTLYVTAQRPGEPAIDDNILLPFWLRINRHHNINITQIDDD